jgi:hypothetical protein
MTPEENLAELEDEHKRLVANVGARIQILQDQIENLKYVMQQHESMEYEARESLDVAVGLLVKVIPHITYTKWPGPGHLHINGTNIGLTATEAELVERICQ